MASKHNKNKPEDRLLGGLPKIGIRPCIDGRRRGVREGLEAQTMQMAISAAKLIQENIRHANGLPVKVVIADTTIGGVAEAVACQEKFQRRGTYNAVCDALLVLRNGDL